MTRYEKLLDSLLKGETVDIVPQSRMEQVLLNCIDKCGCDGLPAPTSRAEAYLQALAEQIESGGTGGGTSGGSNGKVLEVATADEMDAILANATADDVGCGYLYTGETTEAYESYCVYIIRTREE